MTQRDETVMKIVDGALELDPALRAQFIRDACGSDPDLIRAVERLLEVDDLAGQVFDSGAREMRDQPLQIGPYRLLGKIGEGGMGVVWRARQEHPIQRLVALKLIKLGMDTSAVVARFESERQALAMMDHPNVARVFEAGSTPTGRPWFAMEYVDGEPITTFCDGNGYTIRQRLELFLQACEAVQHAHQKALIHRDLKPSNILVTVLNDKPMVKVIDFGVAKAIAQNLTERTLFTETGQLVGTPEYMSPEQAGSADQDVDTRSDVYSLGVVLYELISGALPFDPKTLRAAGFGEIQRIIREVDPPRPSTRLSSLGDEAREIARKRQTHVDVLARQLRGELEWIPLKAMRKDRAQRYATAIELAQDVQNYLAQRPLIAAPESAAYHARKFLKRNRGPVAAAAAILIVLAVGIVSTGLALVGQTRARAEAERQRDSLSVTLDFLTKDVLAGATPERIPDKKVRDEIIRAMIAPAADRVADQFKDRPLIEAAIRRVLGHTYLAIGHADLAMSHAQVALDLQRTQLGDDHPETLNTQLAVGSVLVHLGKYADADATLQDCLQRHQRVFGDADPRTFSAMSQLAAVRSHQGKHDQAESLKRDVLKASRARFGNSSPETASALYALSATLSAMGKHDEAEVSQRESLAIRRRELGPDHPETLGSMDGLAFALVELGNLDEAMVLRLRLAETALRVLGEEHPDTLHYQNNLGTLYLKLNRLDEAETWRRRVLEVHQRTMPDHPSTVGVMNNLAYVLKAKGKLAESETLFRQVVQRLPAMLGDDHPFTLGTKNNLAVTMYLQGKYTEAEPLFADVYRRTPPIQHDPKWKAIYISGWGPCLVKLQRYEEAEAPLREANARLREVAYTGAERRDVITALAVVCDETGRSDEAAVLRAELESISAATRPGTQPAATQP